MPYNSIMNPEIIMLVGAPCSGKSTWRQLNCPDYVLIDTDSYIERVAAARGLTYDELFQDEIKNAAQDMQNRLKRAIAGGQNIVWDQTNMTRKTRVSKLALLPEFYQNRAAVVFMPSVDVLVARNAQRAANTGKAIPESVIRSMMASFEMPTVDEGFTRGVVQVDQ
jgi:predicted kinase